MKTRGMREIDRGRRRSVDRRGVRTDKSPPVSGEYSVARELQKAFGGSTTYVWSDRDGSLLASWSSPRLDDGQRVRPQEDAAGL